MADEPVYYTPDGCVDLPYIYTFDANAPLVLTEGATVNGNIKTMEYNSEFVLRAILGAPTCVDPTSGGILVYNYSQSQSASSPITPPSNQMAVVPERVYPPSGVIKFDLVNIKKALTACTPTIFRSQIGFMGVKRYRPGAPGYGPGNPSLPIPVDPASYTPKPWTYALPLNLNWFYWASTAGAGIQNISRTFVVEVQDYDFELHAIVVSDAVTGVRLTAERFQMTLYDQTAKRALSSIPVNVSFFNNNRTEYGSPTWPVPPLLYPVWTQIRVDIVSLVCNQDASAPYLLQVNFIGVNRIPKAKGTAV